MNKVLLLDFDGVVLVDRHPQNIIKHRAEQLVAKHIRTNDRKRVRAFNSYLYKTHGHTQLGLQNLGYDVSMDDFNKYVYGRTNYRELASNFTDKQVHTNSVLGSLMELPIPIKLFSNAPQEWCYGLLSHMTKDIDRIEYIDKNGYLKPEKGSYEMVNNMFPNHDLYFVDDCLQNLIGSDENSHWTNVWYSTQPLHDSNCAVHVVDDLQKLVPLLTDKSI
jgi:FMN phosphatase YigB (HAD superfamily)